MNNSINIYKELTYIETYDGEVKTTTASLEQVWKLLKDEQFINLWTELINKSNIKRVFVKALSDIDKVLYSIEDKQIREQVKEELNRRKKEWLRVSIWIISNLVDKFQKEWAK